MGYLRRIIEILLACYLLVAIPIAGIIYLWGFPLLFSCKVGFSWPAFPWIFGWIK